MTNILILGANGQIARVATTHKGQPFQNASEQVSRKSVADLVVKLAMTPGLEIRSSLGVHKTPKN